MFPTAKVIFSQSNVFSFFFYNINNECFLSKLCVISNNFFSFLFVYSPGVLSHWQPAWLHYGSLIQCFLLLWDHLWMQSWWCRVWYMRDLPWNLPGRWQWKELLFQCPGTPTFCWCHFRTTKFCYYGSSTVKQAKHRLKFHITVVSTFLFP